MRGVASQLSGCASRDFSCLRIETLRERRAGYGAASAIPVSTKTRQGHTTSLPAAQGRSGQVSGPGQPAPDWTFGAGTLEYGRVRKNSSALLLFASLFCLSIAVPTFAAEGGGTRPALIPQPREFTARPNVSLNGGVRVLAPGRDAEDRFAADDLEAALKDRGVRVSGGAIRIYLLRDDSSLAKQVLRRENLAFDAAMDPEGYVLVTGRREAYVIGHTATGVFYGAQTLRQLVTAGGEPVLQGAAIRDWPAMKWRGVQDDLSRGPVPTLDFQKKQIRTFAEYKLNVYSPYFENTMQYKSTPLPALPGGSISQEDAKALVEYAKQYHVTIVPEQEAFGHLHKVLTWQEICAAGGDSKRSGAGAGAAGIDEADHAVVR